MSKVSISNDGFLTSVWGPATWLLLHTVSLNFPCKPTKLQKRQYMDFIFSLQHVLPCGKCRQNLKDNLSSMRFSLSHVRSRAHFARFIWRLHNRINSSLGKPMWTKFADVNKRYEMFRADCMKQTSKNSHKGCAHVKEGKIKTRLCLVITPESDKETPVFQINK